MVTRARGRTLVAFTGLALFILAVAACSSNVPPQPHTFRLEIQNAQIVGGDTQTFTVKQGDPVTFEVDSDTDGTLNVDAYKIAHPVTVGQTTTVEFTAHSTGSFPVEFGVTGDDELEVGRLNVEPK